MTGTEMIANERNRQVEKEHYSSRHDDDHAGLELARAALCYLSHYTKNAWLLENEKWSDLYQKHEPPDRWPWDCEDWKPKSPVQDLIRAGALIAAEIDRIKRNERHQL